MYYSCDGMDFGSVRAYGAIPPSRSGSRPADASDCAEILSLIEQGKLNTLPLITHYYPLSRIDEAYKLFENKEDGVIKVAIENR